MVLDILNKLKLVDKYIRAQKTGSRDEFSKSIGLSKRQLYYYIDFLKDYGAEIEFCRKTNSYIYKNIVEVEAQLSIKVMSEDEMLNLNAGLSYSFRNSNKKHIYS